MEKSHLAFFAILDIERMFYKLLRNVTGLMGVGGWEEGTSALAAVSPQQKLCINEMAILLFKGYILTVIQAHPKTFLCLR